MEAKKEVMVAIKEVVVVLAAAEVGSSSERFEGVIWVTWPKRRPSMSPGEEETRWSKEAKVGPEI